MRLIDSDELLKHASMIDDDDAGYYLQYVDVSHIRSAPTVIVEPRWIDARKELPKEEGQYVCFCVDETGETSIGVWWYYKDHPEVKDGFAEYVCDWGGYVHPEGLKYWLKVPEVPNDLEV